MPAAWKIWAQNPEPRTTLLRPVLHCIIASHKSKHGALKILKAHHVSCRGSGALAMEARLALACLRVWRIEALLGRRRPRALLGGLGQRLLEYPDPILKP